MKKIFPILVIGLLLVGCSVSFDTDEKDKDVKIEKLEQRLAELEDSNTTTTEEIKEIEEPEQNEPKIIERVIIKEVPAPTPESTPEENIFLTKQEEDVLADISQINPDPEPTISDDTALYKSSLLKQIDSIISSDESLIDYADVVYKYADFTAPRTLDSFEDAISPLQYGFSDSVQQLITKHLEILDMVKASFREKADAIYSLRALIEMRIKKSNQLHATIVVNDSISGEEYPQISAEFGDATSALIEIRNALEHLFEVMVQDIEDQGNSIQESLDAIDSAVGGTTTSITPYFAPSYSPPIFHVTQCFINEGGYGPLTINCSGNTF